MAKVKVLQRRVVAHRWRDVDDVVEVDEYTARQMVDDDPEAFVWLDRPVQQFVDVVEPAPVDDNPAALPARRRSRKAEANDKRAG